jgi:hypothetical protein
VELAPAVHWGADGDRASATATTTGEETMKIEKKTTTLPTKTFGSLRWTRIALFGGAAAIALGCGSAREETGESSQDLKPCNELGCGPKFENPPGACTASYLCDEPLSVTCANTGNGVYDFSTSAAGGGFVPLTTSTFVNQPIAFTVHVGPQDFPLQICPERPATIGVLGSQGGSGCSVVETYTFAGCPDAGPSNP